VPSPASHYPKAEEDAGDGAACPVTDPLTMSGVEPPNKKVENRILKRVGRKNVRGIC